MTEKLRRYAGIMRIIGVLILVGVFGIVVFQVYDFYSDKVGFTAQKALDSYFVALAQHDYATVYQMTDREHLTDIYGRPLTRSEFMAQLEAVVGNERFDYERIEAKKLFDSQNVHYYQVTLYTSINGQENTSQILVQVHRRDKTWYITYPFAILL